MNEALSINVSNNIININSPDANISYAFVFYYLINKGNVSLHRPFHTKNPRITQSIMSHSTIALCDNNEK